MKRRALAFLKSAEHSFHDGNYDLVLFHVEQFMQLYLKYILSIKIGAFPKTHSLTELLREIAKALNALDIEKFYHDNIEIINLLEDSYIAARYLPRVYDKHIAERALEFAKKALEVLKCIEEQL